MIKNDYWIVGGRGEALIKPFEPQLISEDASGRKILSYGVSSFGVNLRLSGKSFKVFTDEDTGIIDPKNFNPDHLEDIPLQSDETGDYFIIPPFSCGLGVALEWVEIPRNILCVLIGKSTYSRSGIAIYVTPAEPGFKGHLTLEVTNHTPKSCKLYANEGVVQMLYLEGEACYKDYEDRNGKYQDQIEEVTLPRA